MAEQVDAPPSKGGAPTRASGFDPQSIDHPHVPSACPPTVSARDDRPHGNAAVGAIDYTHGGGHHGPRQAPMPRLPPTSPRRHHPMPRAHPRTRPGTRHQGPTRIRTRPRPTTPRPRPHRGGRPCHLLAVRPTHPARRPLGPRPRRPRPVHHARPRARIHMQPVRSRQSIARTAAALTSNDASRRASMQGADLRLCIGRRGATEASSQATGLCRLLYSTL